MEAVVALHPHRDSAAVRALLAQAGAELRPMYPGATDSEGRRWHLLHCQDAARLPALLQRLQQHADVDAAYLKPAGAPP
ncbi:hypothetical protein [Pseudorhodoferax sp.]|uniref:hypothetical protein n=1 Tax=Pseudorhodoferax sp. TaxID=1993553 RepID=UPI002DD62221|nr:hypothetical protein [Pseudorhodoferax sp.]